MKNKITGQIYKIFETQEINASFKKREFVVETNEQYPQKIKCELTQNNVSKIDDFKVGEHVTVHLNIRGREWVSPKTNEETYFVSLNAWKIDREDNPSTDFPTTAEAPKDDEDDLPF
jgi:hypothetical protein